MTRIFKTLGTIALALTSIAALWLPSAVAAGEHSEVENTVWTAEQDATEGNQKIFAGGSTLTCTEARLEGTTTTIFSTSLTFKPITTTSKAGTGYSGCTFFGVGVTVNMHTCDFVFHSNGLIDVAGCAGTFPYISYKANIAFIGSCEVRIGNQTALSRKVETNIGSGSTAEITTDINIIGLRYDAVGTLCNPEGNGQTNGVYEGKLTTTGEVDGSTTHVGVSFF